MLQLNLFFFSYIFQTSSCTAKFITVVRKMNENLTMIQEEWIIFTIYGGNKKLQYKIWCRQSVTSLRYYIIVSFIQKLSCDHYYLWLDAANSKGEGSDNDNFMRIWNHLIEQWFEMYNIYNRKLHQVSKYW